MPSGNGSQHATKDVKINVRKLGLIITFRMIKVNIMNVVVFPQSQFTVRMFPDMSLPVSSNCATAPWVYHGDKPNEIEFP